MNRLTLTTRFATLILLLAGNSATLLAQEAANEIATGIALQDSLLPVTTRELFVPFDELDVILANDPNRVYLSRAEFDQLVADAQSSPVLAAPYQYLWSQSDYQLALRGGKAVIEASLELDVLAKNQTLIVPLNLSGASIQQAKLDDQPATLTRSSEGAPQLIVDQPGKHRLSMTLLAVAKTDAALQTLDLNLPRNASGKFAIQAAGNIEVKQGASVAQRTYDADQHETLLDLVLKPGPIQLTLTLNNKQLQNDQLFTTQSVLVSELTQGYERLHATVTYRVLQGAMSQLELELPDRFEVLKVEVDNLARWSVVEQDATRSLIIEFRQPLSDNTTLRLLGNRAPLPGEDWTQTLANWRFPVLEPIGSEVNEALIGLVAEESIVLSTQQANMLVPVDGMVFRQAIPQSLFQADAGAPQVRPVAAFYTPMLNVDWTASLNHEKSALDVATSQILTLDRQGGELSATFAVSPQGETLFELDLEAPLNWSPTLLQVNGADITYDRRPVDEATQHLLLHLPQSLARDTPATLTVTMTHTPESWFQSTESEDFSFPQVRLVEATQLKGAIAVVGLDDLQVKPTTSSELIPLLESEKPQVGLTELAGGLAFRLAGPDYDLTTTVQRIPPRVSATGLSFLKLTPGRLQANYEMTYQVAEAGVREVAFSLPESTPSEIRIDPLDGVVIQDVSNSLNQGRRHWQVRLASPQLGKVRLSIGFSREAATREATEIDLPLIQAENVELQSGLFAVEGDSELDLTVATDARRVDVGELASASYQVGRRLVGSYGFAGAAVPATLAVSPRQAYGLPSAIMRQAQILSHVSPHGKTQSSARYDILAKASLIAIELPKDSVLWTILLDGNPTKPQRDGNRLLLGLPSQQAVTSRSIQIIYETPTPKLKANQGIALVAPRLFVIDALDIEQLFEVPQVDLQWEVALPPGYQLTQTSGTLTLTSTQRPTLALELIGYWLDRFVFEVRPTIGVAEAPAAARYTDNEAQPYHSMDSIEYLGDEKSDALDEADMRGMQAGGMAGSSGAPGIAQFDPNSTEGVFGLSQTRSETLESNETEDEAASDPFGQQPPTGNTQLPTDQSTAPQQATPGLVPPSNEPPSPNDSGFSASGITPSPASPLSTLDGISSLLIDLEAVEGEVYTFASLGEEPTLDFKAIPSKRIRSASIALGLFCLVAGIWLAHRHRRWIGPVVMLGIFAGTLPLLVTTRLDSYSHLLNAVVFAAIAVGVYGVALHTGSWTLQKTKWLIGIGLRKFVKSKSSTVTSSSLLALAFVSLASTTTPVLAQEPSTLASELRNLIEEISGPVSVPQDAIIVPYDPAIGPVQNQNQKLLISGKLHQKLLEATRAKHDESLLPQIAPLAATVSSARYQTRLDESDQLVVEGDLTIHSYRDDPQTVLLPMTDDVIVQATLDDQPARLQVAPAGHDHPNADRYRAAGRTYKPLALYVYGSGEHRFRFTLHVKLKRQGAWRIATTILPPAPVAPFSAEIASANTSITQSGLADISDWESTTDQQTWQTALVDGILNLRWRSQLTEAQVDRSLTAKSVSAVRIDVNGIRVDWQAQLALGRTTRDTFTFDLPGDYTIEAVEGANLRGWNSRPAADRQIVDVALLEPATEQVSLTLRFFKPLPTLIEPQNIQVPVLMVRDAALESGELMIQRGNHVSIETTLNDGISRTDPTPALAAVQESASQAAGSLLSTTPYQAFRFVTPPYDLRLRVARKTTPPRTQVQSVLRLSSYQAQLDTQLQVQPADQPVYELLVQIPLDFVPRQIESGDCEWSISETTGEKLLEIRFLDGRSEPFNVNLLGDLADFSGGPSQPGNSITTPLPKLSLPKTNQQPGEIVVIPDPDIDVKIIDPVACVGESLSIGPGWMRPEQRSLARARVSYQTPDHSANLQLTARIPQLTTHSYTNIRVTPHTIEQTTLVKIEIRQAGIRQVIIDVPDSIANDQIEARLIKEIRRSPLVDEQGAEVSGWQRLTLELLDDVRNEYVVLLNTDKTLDADNFQVELPLPQTGQLVNRLVAIENAGRDEVKIAEEQSSVYQLLNRQESDWQALTSVVGPAVAQGLTVDVDATLVSLAISLIRRQEVQQVGARIGIATTTLVVDSSGAYRGLIELRVSNADEPYLDLVLPNGAQVWTVQVANEPSKAIRATNAADSIVRIPLVKTAIGEGDYLVAVKYGGKLPMPGSGARLDFPLIQTENINVEQSQVRLFLPDDRIWFDFAGTMKQVDSEQVLAEGFLNYIGKRIQEATSSVQLQSSSFSKVRATMNLMESRVLLQDQTDNYGIDSSSFRSKRLEFENMISRAEAQLESELGQLPQFSMGNRSNLKRNWEQQDNQRGRNVAVELGSNFSTAEPQTKSPSTPNRFNVDWLEKNELQTKPTSGPGNGPAGKDQSNSRQLSAYGNSAAEKKVDLADLSLNSIQQQTLADREVTQTEEAPAEQQVDKYRQQLERRANSQGQRSQPSRSSQTRGYSLGGVAQFEGGIELSGEEMANQTPLDNQGQQDGQQPNQEIFSPFGAGPQSADGIVAVALIDNSDSGFVSLDFELPQQGRAYLFTTPRGDIQITARQVDDAWYERGPWLLGMLVTAGAIAAAWITGIGTQLNRFRDTVALTLFTLSLGLFFLLGMNLAYLATLTLVLAGLLALWAMVVAILSLKRFLHVKRPTASDTVSD